ncbi:MAG TPA: molybdenum ABC transporter ATP-binding protein [Spirochaetota bacterium]|nr:molybdenum ABC transporter ATP-binding protein [Spirochaetota bacterium]HPV40105.1 molybdenum ABC transporter ATP-binding protein [Spirochaetota bacterium]
MKLRMDIQKRFGVFHLNADFKIEGDRIGIFGPSGSGKSTLMGILAGLHCPDEGVIEINGETIFDSRRGINIAVPFRRIGMVFQRPHLFPHLTVKRNLLYGYRRCPAENRRITVESLISALEIGHLLDRGVANLSGGERQRVAIGRAVLSNPRILVMDEPLTGLDDNLKFQIIPYLKNACETSGIPYLFISHSQVETRIMTDRVLTLEEGRVTGQMSGEELARSRMKDHIAGYINLLKLRRVRDSHGMAVYHWGDRELFLSSADDHPEAIFELSSAEIILCKQRPESISARNILRCRVADVFETGRRLGVELAFGKERLIAEIVRQAAEDLDIRKGKKIYAVIKASAFRKLR